MFNPQSRVPRPKSGRTLKWRRTRAVGRVRASAFLLPITLLCFATSFSQIHIHEKVDITGERVKSVGLMKPGQPPPSVTSGFVIPRGSALRTSLQIQYGSVYRLDWEMPSYASLEMYRRGSTFVDSLRQRFPDSLYGYDRFTNFCGPDEWHWWYYYTPTAAAEWDTVARVSRGDTVFFAYITQRSGPLYWLRDTLHIISADTVRVRELSGDSVVVGWSNVMFGNGNACLGTWWDKLEVFVGLNCATYQRLLQGDSGWGTDHYLWAYDTTSGNEIPIRRLGCALTCMAMIGQSFGLIMNPGTLNSFMQGYYTPNTTRDDSLSVRWQAVAHDWPGGSPLRFLFRKSGDRTTRTVRLTYVDSLLAECHPIIAQVINPTTGNNHWVIVQSKDQNGRYPIVDPGNYDRPYLDAYSNRIYKIIVYGK